MILLSELLYETLFSSRMSMTQVNSRDSFFALMCIRCIYDCFYPTLLVFQSFFSYCWVLIAQTSLNHLSDHQINHWCELLKIDINLPVRKEPKIGHVCWAKYPQAPWFTEGTSEVCEWLNDNYEKCPWIVPLSHPISHIWMIPMAI